VSTTLSVTRKHIERGQQMRRIVECDVTNLGISAEAAIENIAAFLEIDVEAVQLAIAIANEADRGGQLLKIDA
jgi:hypothetical protein